MVMVIFLYYLYIVVWIQHGCLAYMIFALDLSNSVTKRLWCNYQNSGTGCQVGAFVYFGHISVFFSENIIGFFFFFSFYSDHLIGIGYQF